MKESDTGACVHIALAQLEVFEGDRESTPWNEVSLVASHADGAQREADFVVLAKGFATDAVGRDPHTAVVRNQREFHLLWKGRVRFIDPKIPPMVSFEHSTVIVVYLGKRSQEGPLPDARRVVPRGDHFVIEVEEVQSGKGCLVIPQESFPFIVLQVHETLTPNKVRVERSQVRRDCLGRELKLPS